MTATGLPLQSTDLRLSVIGCGYLGAVHAAAMASLGHRVVGIDTDPTRVAQLSAGVSPFYEPGLDELLSQGVASGRLTFTDNIAEAGDADLHFICVGTPQVKDGSAADLSFVDAAIESLLPHLRSGAIVVGKSTVPVGTAARLAASVNEAGAELAWNPEFLREGWAVKDTLEPDRIVIGVASAEPGEHIEPAEHIDPAEHATPGGPAEPSRRAEAMLREVYATPLDSNIPCIVTDYATAELVKVSANAFLATKISFINAMAEIAEATGADVTTLADAIGHDDRIGRRFLGAGIGFGGGCLPKDIRAFAARAEELGLRESVGFLREVDAINLRRREHAVNLVVDELGGSVLAKRVTVLGAAFKPFSDDTRDSPALFAATRLHGLGANVVVTDPRAIENARRVHPQLTYEPDLDRALSGAEIVLLVTEWNEYRYDLRPEHAAALVDSPVIVDARNCLDRDAWRAAGWKVRGMGRP